MRAHFADALDKLGRIIVTDTFEVKSESNKNSRIFAIGDCCITPFNEVKLAQSAQVSAELLCEGFLKNNL
jgi:NADH dehydrogenase FAD-containing subunit